MTITDAVPANAAFVYCVQAVDSSGGASPCGGGDVATTMPLDSIVSGSTVIAATQFQHVLDAVNAMYDIWGGAHVQWTGILTGVQAPAPGVAVAAQHVTALRSAIVTGRSQLTQHTGISLGSVTFTDNSLTSGMLIRGVHVVDLQKGVQ
jgi:hypothetical protein